MNTVSYCYIKESYYKDYPDLKQILDVNDPSKHNIRTHICLKIDYNKSHILIPLRKSLGEAERKFGKIGFPVPSESKPDAGLDYRYIMVIKDEKYIRSDKPRIPMSQQRIIQNNYSTIEKEALEYISSYVKTASKGRVETKARFRASSLINFHHELGVKNYSKKVHNFRNNDTLKSPQKQKQSSEQ